MFFTRKLIFFRSIELFCDNYKQRIMFPRELMLFLRRGIRQETETILDEVNNGRSMNNMENVKSH